MMDKTYTIIGTPHYMAREIIIGKGYNMYVDLWSLGICLFEFMTGIVPFGEDEVDPYNIYDKIIKLEIDFSPTFKDKKAKKLIEQLLNKVPELRLRGDNYDALKNHPWFENFDWEKL
jgi:cGMP-dependent protein kinase